MPKICIDCKYISGNNTYYCNHPNGISLVTGDHVLLLASTMRGDSSRCGPEGRWFETDTAKFSEGPETPRNPPIAI